MSLSTSSKISPHTVGQQGRVPARRSRRILAYGLDIAVFVALGIVFPPTLLLMFVYMCLRDIVRGSGRSLGRSAVDQRLMSVDGDELPIKTVILRNVVRSLLWMLIFPIFIDLFLVLFGGGRIIADHMFKTRVFEDPEEVQKRDQDAFARAREVLEKNRSQPAAQPKVSAVFDDDGLAEESIQAKKKSLKDLEFDAPDYDRRQLDDFDSRLDAIERDVEIVPSVSTEVSADDIAELERALQDDDLRIEQEAPAEVTVPATAKRS